MNILNTKINNFGSERLTWRFEQFQNSPWNLLWWQAREMRDAKRLVTALYPISVARAQ